MATKSTIYHTIKLIPNTSYPIGNENPADDKLLSQATHQKPAMEARWSFMTGPGHLDETEQEYSLSSS